MEHPSTDCGAPGAKSDINSNENGGCEVFGMGWTAWRCQQVEKAVMACAALRPPRCSPKHTHGIHVMSTCSGWIHARIYTPDFMARPLCKQDRVGCSQVEFWEEFCKELTPCLSSQAWNLGSQLPESQRNPNSFWFAQLPVLLNGDGSHSSHHLHVTLGRSLQWSLQ